MSFNIDAIVDTLYASQDEREYVSQPASSWEIEGCGSDFTVVYTQSH